MKKSKQSKARKCQNKVDHISNLPDPILHMILSRLHSTEEVVGTSILSPRWKYLWSSVPSLNIDFTRKAKEPFTLVHKNAFKEFVDRVLANRTLDLDSLTLKCRVSYDMSTIGQWIDLAVMQKVKELDLEIFDENVHFIFPSCLVDCDSLKVLKLFGSSLSFKNFTGSKTLKIFEMDSIDLLDHDLFSSFLVNCPSLEELSFIACSTITLDCLDISSPNLKTLRINNRGYVYEEEESLCQKLKLLCPKLVYFDYRGYMTNHFSFDVKSLKKVVIELEDLEDISNIDDNYGFTLRMLFAQVSHVEHVSIYSRWIPTITMTCETPEEGFPSLPNLKTLVTTIACCSMDVLDCILKCSPNLESFHMIIIKRIPTEEVKRFIDEVERRRTLTRHLKRVEFLEFSGKSELLAIARFLLEHGNVLEEMVFSWSDKDKYHTQSMDIVNQVSSFYKVSLSVKVITLLKDSSYTDSIFQ